MFGKQIKAISILLRWHKRRYDGRRFDFDVERGEVPVGRQQIIKEDTIAPDGKDT